MSNTSKHALSTIWLIPDVVLSISSLHWTRVLPAVTVVMITVILAACSVVNRPEGWAGAVVLNEVVYTGTKEGDEISIVPAVAGG